MPHLAADNSEPAPRIVKPRSRKYHRLPIVAIHGGQTLTEDGTYGEVDDLIRTLPKRDSTLFIKYGAADFVAGLDQHFAAQSQSWQWKATSNERIITRPDGVKVAARVTTAISFFGFKHGRYHKIIDPVTMHARSLDDIWPSGDSKIVRLLKWGIAIRNFCDDNGMDVRPTVGGISAQFLTDPRFYSRARRKVPITTNDAVREELPGNYYYLSVKPGTQKEYTAYYIDQSYAHHYHAARVHFPDADTLYAHGRFQDVSEITFPDVWPRFYGLYCLDLQTPDRHIPLAIRNWLQQHYRDRVLEKRYVFSNELPFLLDLGYKVLGVRAAWGSRHRDTGIRTYAKWAIEQLGKYDSAAWVKPILLATYGTLATRPKIVEIMFQHAKNGEPTQLKVGANMLTGVTVRGRRRIEPRAANVLHRGMIEAATRVESLSYAHYLTTMKYHYQVLCIYADAVIVMVDDDKPLPPVIDPWRMKETLNHLQFINTQSFQSGEMTRLPGVPGISRDSLNHRQATPGHAPRMRKHEALSGRIIPNTYQSKKEKALHGDVR